MKIITPFLLTFFIISNVNAQNSSIKNHNFEKTNWQEIAWFSQTNTGSAIIVNENNPYFIKKNIVAYSGSQFAYIGGSQNASGLYEGDLAQEINIPYPGNARLTFAAQYINESTDPGSVITISIDNNIVWTISPHFIVDSPYGYEIKFAELGYLEAGNHTIEIHGYENTIGGEIPMQFAFDDFNLNVLSNAGIETEKNIDLSVLCTFGNIQLELKEALNENVIIELLDLNGKIITTSTAFIQHSHTLPVQSLTTGVYLLNIKTNNQTISRKLYIQQ